MDKAATAKVCIGGRGVGGGGGGWGWGRGVGGGGAGDEQSRLVNILSQFYTVLYMEMRGIYITLNRLYMKILIFNN